MDDGRRSLWRQGSQEDRVAVRFRSLPIGESPADEQLERLLPDRWLQSHPQYRWIIDELRKEAERV